MGRPHEIPGTVKTDRSVGAKIGFPTINLRDINVVIPSPGIYAANCIVREQCLAAAAYIGERPTMGAGFAVEAHLLDFEGDLYGQRVSLQFLERIRDDRKFESADQLTRQIARDISYIRSVLGARHG